jgi:hypothetical protein
MTDSEGRLRPPFIFARIQDIVHDPRRGQHEVAAICIDRVLTVVGVVMTGAERDLMLKDIREQREAYDTQYAMVDRDDDLKIGVKSTAILFGEQDHLIIGLLQAVLLFDLILVGRQLGFGTTYYVGVAFAAMTVLWQQWLIRHRRRDDCFRAFLNNHWLGLFVFGGISLDYIFATAALIR